VIDAELNWEDYISILTTAIGREDYISIITRCQNWPPNQIKLVVKAKKKGKKTRINI
jgi:hypothetical protein